jgi:hypothetical protein
MPKEVYIWAKWAPNDADSDVSEAPCEISDVGDGDVRLTTGDTIVWVKRRMLEMALDRIKEA